MGPIKELLAWMPWIIGIVVGGIGLWQALEGFYLTATVCLVMMLLLYLKGSKTLND